MIPRKYNLIELEEALSTNDSLKATAQQGELPEFTVLSARSQTSGRGLSGNIWHSDPGKNLTCSILLYPDFIPVQQQFQLNKAIALALTDCIETIVSGTEIKIKWPNDIYCDGKKICGILIENSVCGMRYNQAVVGIGLNVNQILFPGHIPNPVSLRQISGKNFDIVLLLDLLMEKIISRYEMLRQGKTQIIDNDYYTRMYLAGVKSEFILQGKKTEAVIEGVNTYGQLILRLSDGEIKECQMKEVVFSSLIQRSY